MLGFVAGNLGHLVEVVATSEVVGVVNEDVELGSHVEGNFHTGGNSESEFALGGRISQRVVHVVVFVQLVDGTALVVEATDTDVRHQVDDSSRVVVENVEQVEGQVQVALNVVRLVKTEVFVNGLVGVAVENELLAHVLVARKETVTALKVQADDFAKLVANAQMGVPVLEGHGLQIIVGVGEHPAFIVGQVAVVDGETSVSLDVPVLLSRALVLIAHLLSHHAQRQNCDDEKHQQLRKSQIFLHNAIVLGW